MTITIDGAGRIVVPKKVRDRLNLQPGAELEAEIKGDVLTLRNIRSEPSLIRKQGLLIHHGSEKSDLDLVRFMEGERQARALRQGDKS
jgi:AbrB family looped-hinge helix DNA binding protein